MSNNIQFSCTEETVKILYNFFDNLIKLDSKSFETIKKGGNVFLENIEGISELVLRYDNTDDIGKVPSGLYLPETLKVVFNGDIVEVSTSHIRIDFNDGYFYKPMDVLRTSDRGFLGLMEASGIVHIYSLNCTPTNGYFKEICEPRKDYKDIIKSRYSKTKLPSYFNKITDNEEYKEFFKNNVKSEYTANRLFDNGGAIFCRNMTWGYSALEFLKGVESDFYNELLECVVGLGKPINSVYFYSDLNWSCMLYRESINVEGEYEIVIK